MSEVGGITELQLLQAQASMLKNQLEGIEGAEKTSVACARVISCVVAAEGKDGFIVKEGGTAEQNLYHTSAGPAADGGCCMVL
jgi:hypothetical protein